jgi:choline dehydrogenase-like flavoprotein
LQKTFAPFFDSPARNSDTLVNRDLAARGLDNFHVASCAVFPSGSSSNPTFTMMALTLRLAIILFVKSRSKEP